jgi:hypothetical protein
MRNRRFECAAVLAVSIAVSLSAACGSDLVAQDCTVKCDNVRNDCTKKCSDDTCKSNCSTNFNDCKASCEKVSTKSDGG